MGVGGQKIKRKKKLEISDELNVRLRGRSNSPRWGSSQITSWSEGQMEMLLTRNTGGEKCFPSIAWFHWCKAEGKWCSNGQEAPARAE